MAEWIPIETSISLPDLIKRWKGVVIAGTSFDFQAIDSFVRSNQITAYDKKDWIIVNGHKEWRGQKRSSFIGLNDADPLWTDDKIIFDMEEIYRFEKQTWPPDQDEVIQDANFAICNYSEVQKALDKEAYSAHELVYRYDIKPSAFQLYLRMSPLLKPFHGYSYPKSGSRSDLTLWLDQLLFKADVVATHEKNVREKFNIRTVDDLNTDVVKGNTRIAELEKEVAELKAQLANVKGPQLVEYDIEVSAVEDREAHEAANRLGLSVSDFLKQCLKEAIPMFQEYPDLIHIAENGIKDKCRISDLEAELLEARKVEPSTLTSQQKASLARQENTLKTWLPAMDAMIKVAVRCGEEGRTLRQQPEFNVMFNDLDAELTDSQIKFFRKSLPDDHIDRTGGNRGKAYPPDNA